MLPEWLNAVHHDGSEKYVSQLTPALGAVVQVRLRVDGRAPVKRVLLRTFPDGEQFLADMQPAGDEPPVRWWQADLPINQPMVHYRFLIEAEDGVYWYTAAGAVAYEPLDVTDFQILADYASPAWLQQAVFYQIFPDRFANGDPSTNPLPEEYEYRGHRPQTFAWGQPPAAEQPFTITFYGGDLPGITQHLDYLEHLGVNALYLTPVFTAFSNHKYDVADYDHVDPHFGGDQALAELRQALTARHMRYLLDIVPNHCGYWHPWFTAARADPNAPEAEFFTFNQHPDDYVSWLGVWSLPKLNYRSEELRRRIYSGENAVFKHWLRPPYSADGWRVDVANMLGRQGATQISAEIAGQIRAAVKQTNPQAYLMGENFFDASNMLQGDQFDGVMNYMGFAVPLLHWLRGFQAGSIGLKEPIHSPVPWPTEAVEATWRMRRAAIPWVMALQQYNLLGSHDTPRLRSIVQGNEALVRMAMTLLLTFPGVPGLYYGDEIGLEDTALLRSRGCMPWDTSQWNHAMLAFSRDLIALRKRSTVLQRGGFQVLAVEADTLAYQREGVDGRVIVVAHRSTTPRPAGDMHMAQGGIADGTRFVEHFSGASAVVTHGALPLPEQAQGASLWEQVV